MNKFLIGVFIGANAVIIGTAIKYHSQHVKLEGHYTDSSTGKYHEYKCLETK